MTKVGTVFIESACDRLAPSMILSGGLDEDGPYNGMPFILTVLAHGPPDGLICLDATADS